MAKPRFKKSMRGASEPEQFRADYPKEPIGGGNPYYCCASCKLSDPQINGRISAHQPWCSWRLEQEMKGNGTPVP